MKDALEKLFRHSTIFLVGIVFQRATRLFLLPVYFSLTRAQFGLLDLFESFIQLMSNTFSFGLPSAYVKFSRVDLREGMAVESLRGTTLVLTGLGLVLLGIAMVVFERPLSWLFFKGSYPHYYAIAGGVIVTNIFFLTTLGFIRARGRAGLFVVLSSLQFLFFMLLNIYFVVIRKMGVAGFLWGALFGWALPAVLYAATQGGHARVRFDPRVARQLLRFSLPLVPYGLLMFVVMSSQRLFLQHTLGDEAVGIYAAANRMGLMYALVAVLPFQTAWGYLGLDFMRLPDAREIYSRIFTYLLFGSLWLFLAASAFGRELIVFIGGQEYRPALPYIDLLMAGYLMQLFFYWANNAQVARNMTVQVLVVSLAPFAVALAGGWLFIPKYGIGAAGAVFVAAMAVHALATTVIAQRLVGFSFEGARVVKVLAVFAVVYAVGWPAAGLSPAWRWVAAVVEAAAFPLMLMALGFLNAGEIARLRELARAVRVPKSS